MTEMMMMSTMIVDRSMYGGEWIECGCQGALGQGSFEGSFEEEEERGRNRMMRIKDIDCDYSWSDKKSWRRPVGEQVRRKGGNCNGTLGVLCPPLWVGMSNSWILLEYCALPCLSIEYFGLVLNTVGQYWKLLFGIEYCGSVVCPPHEYLSSPPNHFPRISPLS